MIEERGEKNGITYLWWSGPQYLTALHLPQTKAPSALQPGSAQMSVELLAGLIDTAIAALI